MEAINKYDKTPSGNLGLDNKSKTLKARPFVRIKRKSGQEVLIQDRPAQTLAFLVRVGKFGATRLEFTQAGWARSVSSYIFDLRQMGIEIESPLEEIEQGVRVSRYRLVEEIQILDSNIGGAK